MNPSEFFCIVYIFFSSRSDSTDPVETTKTKNLGSGTHFTNSFNSLPGRAVLGRVVGDTLGLHAPTMYVFNRPITMR